MFVPVLLQLGNSAFSIYRAFKAVLSEKPANTNNYIQKLMQKYSYN